MRCLVTNCEYTPLIHLYYDGELPAERAAAAEAHLAGCPACAAELASLRNLSAQLRFAPLPAAPAGLAARVHRHVAQAADSGALRLTWWLTAAAALVLVTCLVRLEQAPGGTAGLDSAAADWVPAATLGVMNATHTPALSEEHQVARWMVADLSGRLALGDEDAGAMGAP